MFELVQPAKPGGLAGIVDAWLISALPDDWFAFNSRIWSFIKADGFVMPAYKITFSSVNAVALFSSIFKDRH